MNVRVLEKILTSGCDYWLLKKENINNHGDELRPNIIMVGFPQEIPLGKDRKEITLCDLEKLESVNIAGNIYLNEAYPPFQHGLNLYNVTDAYPIPSHQTEFMVKALELKSHDFWDYKNLIDEVCVTVESK